MKSELTLEYLSRMAHYDGSENVVRLSDAVFACNLCEEETEARVREELLSWRRLEDSLPETGVVVDVRYTRCGKTCHAYCYRPTFGADDYWQMDWVSGDAGKVSVYSIIGWRPVLDD